MRVFSEARDSEDPPGWNPPLPSRIAAALDLEKTYDMINRTSSEIPIIAGRTESQYDFETRDFNGSLILTIQIH